MLRAILGAVLFFGPLAVRCPCQQLAATPSGASIPATVSIKGQVQAISEGPLPGAKVWVAGAAAPGHHLAETKTTAGGEFSLSFSPPDEGQSAKKLVVGAEHPGYLEACEPIDPTETLSSAPVQILLRSAAASYDSPDLDLVDAWLYRRFKELVKAERLPRKARSAVESALRLYRERPTSRNALLHVLRSLGPLDYPSARLLKAEALFRLGAWSAAGKSLAPLASQDKALPEGLLLEGVRYNLLREPEQAIPFLERASGELPGDGLLSLELGRAYLTGEKWAAAVQNLEPALRKRALRPQARYLRTRALMSMGDLEAASYEATMFLQPRRKNVPVPVQSFMADVVGRVEERSIRPIDSVMTEPVEELEKAVPDLAGLDTSAARPAEGLAGLLRQVGRNVEKFMKEFGDTAALEVIRQARLDSQGEPAASRTEEFYYIFTHREWKGRPWIEEFRATREGIPAVQGGLDAGYMTTSGFASSLIVFHPDLQPEADFRFLGRQSVGERPTYVIAFAQRPGDSRPMGTFRKSAGGGTYSFFLQGIAWISVDQHQVLRLRTDLLHPLVDAQLSRETTEIDYQPYRFATAPQTFCLPTRVTVSLEWGGRRLRNEHIFSRFWLFKVDTMDQKAGKADVIERAKAAETH